MTAEANVGVVGLAAMGASLARNLARHGNKVAVFNRHYSRTEKLITEHGSEGEFFPAKTMEEFVASLKKPRTAIIMVKAGEPTDAMINALADLMEPGDIIVAGANFGCGSSREHAPLAIKACGVKCVIAPSFARIFYRNAINIGFPILECAEAAEGIQAGDTVSVDFSTGVITDETTGKTYQAAPLPAFVQGIVDNGGLLKSLKARGAAK